MAHGALTLQMWLVWARASGSLGIAAVRLDIIADLSRGYDPALPGNKAERVLEQLVPPDPRPAPRAVPSVPLRRLARIPILLNLTYLIGPFLGGTLIYSSSNSTAICCILAVLFAVEPV
jgi:hypothetical protein